ncbi:hypothetical protein DC3_52810 [Deinococcus cellulosilyticus NBRC 106333 = KACC 11606]|uniref:Uncharacterized protein n=2 Tax=Deinococcus cellulosilyticus TaxID=401558 RepID=A0A511NAS3_DEIC1|nr:hypothetical protein DC3_52810 [Deinococcus cellulosilyticus NBRC 106333 = KACC 11606]
MLFFSTLAHAAQTQSIKTQQGGNLKVTLQECYRQNEFFVVCNFNLQNADRDHKTVLLGLEDAKAKDGQQALQAAAVAVGGGNYNTSPYDNLNVMLPGGVTQMVQVKFQPGDAATELTQVSLFNAVFPVTPLTSEPFTYPVVNPRGERLNSLTEGNRETAVVSCYRLPSKEVHCLVLNRNLGLNPLEVSSYRATQHAITPDGFAVVPFNVAVGSLSRDFGDYNSRNVPGKAYLASYLMFNLPEDVTYLPVLQAAGIPFRNIPIDGAESERLLALQPGQPLLDTRNDNYRAVISACSWDTAETEWVKCKATFKSANRQKHQLLATGAFAITDDGLTAEFSFDEPYQTHEVPADGTLDVNVWLKPASKDIKAIAYLEFDGLVFRNVPVK